MPDILRPEDKQAIISAADSLIEEAIDFLQGMLRIPSINPPGVAYPECASYIGERLAALGYQVEYITLSAAENAELAPYGEGLPRTNVLGRLPGPQSSPVIHFNGHMDVVPVGMDWSTPPFGGEVRAGRVYGRGAADMKGGIAAQVYAVEAIRRAGLQLQGTVEQSGVVDEESTGNRNAGMGLLVERGLISSERTDYVVITEPLNIDNICLGHRGAIWGEIQTIGRQSHGSTPAQGVNALEHMAGFIDEVTGQLAPRLRQRQNHYPVVPATANAASLSFNVIQGGTNVNSVPDSCCVAFDRRLVTSESLADARQELWDILERRVQTIPDFRYEYKERYAAAPTWVSAETPLVQSFASAIQHILGRAPGYVCSPGTDDQRFVVQNAGIEQCIIYGPGEITQAHIVDESLAIADLLVSIKIMALATAELLGVQRHA
ncbi:ArgE/DapE family deacylase [Dictyobacter kobayashii]|uniref:Succinyl-diaminopimelate desuccinylase n=1 Tax=Dictyobacter kobayashii TaxID=2014872 RepID=A0A402ACP0_9CHLR|nr:ArgE/DapE family deacylase [Dictyobacter kobayashii]GCE16864.1 succinyl-diaminopimelate desuccinylase [Dictyobacter kobayashii]